MLKFVSEVMFGLYESVRNMTLRLNFKKFKK